MVFAPDLLRRIQDSGFRCLPLLVAGIASLGWLLDTPLSGARPLTFTIITVVVVWTAASLIRTSAPYRFHVLELVILCLSVPLVVAALGGASGIWTFVLGIGLAAAFVVLHAVRATSLDPFCQRLGLALLVVNVVAVLQVLHNVFQLFLYDTAVFDHVMYILLKPFFAVAWGPESLIVSDGRSTESLHVSYEQTHLVWALRFMVLWFIFGTWFGIRTSNRRFLLTGLAYSLAGVLSWLLISTGVWYVGRDPAVWLNRQFAVACEFAGVLAVFSLLPRLKPAVADGTRAVLPGCGAPDTWWLALGVCLLTVACLWIPLGARKPSGLVLIDDHHSSWEDSDLPYDFSDDAFTRRAGYSYSNFAAFLSKCYHVRVNEESLTADRLAGVSVLILKTPTVPFDAEETAAIREFVKAGGGLFVHGDHTNLYGMSTILNDLLEPAGAAFNFDDQAALNGGPSKVSFPNRLCYHPCVRGLDDMQFLTSCTLKLRNPWAEPVIVGEEIFSENLNYGRPGFFGNMAFDGRDRYGRFVQAAVVPYGRGRIALFADSTLFSNFTLFSSSQADYALRTIDYLHRPVTNHRKFLMLAAVVCFVFAIVAWWRSKESFSRVIFQTGGAVCASGVLTGALLAAALSYRDGGLAPEHDVQRVAVMLGKGNVTDSLTLSETNETQRVTDFGSLLLVLQRMGFYPRVISDLSEAEGQAALALINPESRLTNAQVAALREQVIGKGLKLFVTLDMETDPSVANTLLAPFGIRTSTLVIAGEARQGVPGPALDLETQSLPLLLERFTDMRLRQRFTLASTSPQMPISVTRRSILGGQVLAYDDTGVPFLSRVVFPSGGVVMVCADSSMFSALNLGGGFMKSLEAREVEGQKAVARILDNLQLPTPGAHSHQDHALSQRRVP